MEKAPPTSSQWVLDFHPSRPARNQTVYLIGLISSGISGIPRRHAEVLPCWPEGHRFHRGPRGLQSRDQQLGWGANREWEVPPLSWTNATFNPPIWEVSITVYVLYVYVAFQIRLKIFWSQEQSARWQDWLLLMPSTSKGTGWTASMRQIPKKCLLKSTR